MNTTISLIIPAHNEGKFLNHCLEAANLAASRIESTVEMIVILNRCTDDTEEIAIRHGCRIVREDAKNLSMIRNAGVTVARGEVVVTCDADSRMHPDSFQEILRRLGTGNVVGGGAMVLPERWSRYCCQWTFDSALPRVYRRDFWIILVFQRGLRGNWWI